MKKNFKESVNEKFDEIIKDPSYIEPVKENKKPFPLWAKIAIPVVSAGAVAVSFMAFVIPALRSGTSFMGNVNMVENTSFKEDSRNFSKLDMEVANKNNYVLNNINYPTTQGNYSYSNEELNSYLNYTYQISKNINYSSFSPVSLYSVLHALDYGISDNEMKDLMDNLLGLNINKQTEFYQKIFKNNFYTKYNGTTQMYNGAFFNNSNNDYTYNPEYINYLSNNYYEAYSLNLNTELDEVVEWINKALNSKNIVNKDYLELSDYTALYLVSTLYFDHYWSYKYISDNNITDDFYLSNGSTIKTTYMKHSYRTNGFYEYDDYISFTDSYSSGEYITYLVPKRVEDNILDLVNNKNYLIEDETKFIGLNPEEGIYDIFINLKTPKFETKIDYKFNDVLKGMGFEKMFDPNYNTLGNGFIDNTGSGHFYLENIKQRNQVKFSEDGSLVKTFTVVQEGYGGSAAPGAEADGNMYYNIELNQPFIYIIKDEHGLPLFVGYMDNPQK